MRAITITLEEYVNGIRKERGFVVKELYNTINYKISQILSEAEVMGLLKDDWINVRVVGK